MNFRCARHTNNLSKIEEFYTKILCLDILGSFKNHNNYDGVFLGKQNLNWHLEFTQSSEKATHQFNEDDILVFYPDTKNSYDTIIENIKKYNIDILEAKNPFWNTNGVLVKDPDGYNIIISHLKFK